MRQRATSDNNDFRLLNEAPGGLEFAYWLRRCRLTRTLWGRDHGWPRHYPGL